MGGTSYSARAFTDRVDSTLGAGKSYFSHSTDIDSGKVAAKVHEKLDPSKLNTSGVNIRESLDSDLHPNSNAVAILFDVTGSMMNVPKQFVTKLGNLMALLTKKNYLSDPQILFGAIGDAYVDRAPLQLGQFESGNEMDECLSLFFLEGGGGGQKTESYELAMYYMARKTKMDCLDKRGKKGYLFLSGDELPYSKVSKDQVKRIIGDTLQENIKLETILDELREKFEVFWILPNQTSNYNDPDVVEPLQKMFGQNLIKLEKPQDVCELIATTIGVNEGFDIKSIEADLVSFGSSKSSAKSASTALSTYITSSALTKKVAVVEGTLEVSGKDTVERL